METTQAIDNRRPTACYQMLRVIHPGFLCNFVENSDCLVLGTENNFANKRTQKQANTDFFLQPL